MQGENERQWKKKVKKKTYDISSIKRVTKKFLEGSRWSRAKQRQRNVQEKCAARTLASHASVFRGTRFSSLPKNACSTEDNIPFPRKGERNVVFSWAGVYRGGGGWKTSSPKNTCVGGYTYTCKVAFLLIRPIVVFFTILRRCLRHLALHDFIFCLSKL